MCSQSVMAFTSGKYKTRNWQKIKLLDLFRLNLK